MTRELSKAELEAIKELAVAGRLIEAIKGYRDLTGAGLAEAKLYVDGLLVVSTAEALPQELLDLYLRSRSTSGPRGSLDQDLAAAAAHYGEPERLAAAREAGAMLLRACQLVEEARRGRIHEGALPARLEEEHPGFGPDSYSAAIEYGFLASR